MTNQSSAYRAELQELLDVLGGAAQWSPPATELDELHELLARTERAVTCADVEAVRQARGDLIRLRPRLAGLGERAAVPVAEVPLAQIADLVHRVRVVLTADVAESTAAVPVEAEVRESGAEHD